MCRFVDNVDNVDNFVNVDNSDNFDNFDNVDNIDNKCTLPPRLSMCGLKCFSSAPFKH